MVYTTPVPLSLAVVLLEKPFQAVFIKRAFTWSGVREGSFCSRSAATPLTTGVAILVPLSCMYRAEPYIAPQDVRELLQGKTANAGYSVSSVLLDDAFRETTALPGATRSGFTTWSNDVGPLEL